MAKRYRRLWPQLTSFNNLWWAFKKAAKGKRGKASVAAFEYNLEENLLQLQAELQDGSYQPGAYHSFYIHDPKRRLISAAPFRDRVIHHAPVSIRAVRGCAAVFPDDTCFRTVSARPPVECEAYRNPGRAVLAKAVLGFDTSLVLVSTGSTHCLLRRRTKNYS